MAEYPDSNSLFDVELAGLAALDLMKQWYEATRQQAGAQPWQALTIADGQIAPVSAEVTVDTEGQAPADDLELIATAGTNDGMLLYLKAASPERAVTVKHNATAEFGIRLIGGADRALPATSPLLLKRDGNAWNETLSVDTATAATATADGLPGAAVLAADNDKTSRDKAATPAGVAAQIATQNIRTAYTVDTDIYLAPDGDDTADGLTPATAFASWERVRQFMRQADLRGNRLTINLAAGTYTTPDGPFYINEDDICFCSALFIVGDSPDTSILDGQGVTSEILIISAIRVIPADQPDDYRSGAFGSYPIALHNIGITNGGGGIMANSQNISIGSINFSNLSGRIIYGAGHSIIGVGFHLETDTINVTNCAAGMFGYAYGYSLIVFGNIVVNFSGCSFSVATAYAVRWSSISIAANAVFSGTPTGKRYSTDQFFNNIDARGAGANRIPGTVAGTVAAPSIYS